MSSQTDTTESTATSGGRIAVIGTRTAAEQIRDLAGAAQVDVTVAARVEDIDLTGVRVVIEAGQESVQARADVLRAAAQLADPDAVLVTTTSTLSVAQIALATRAPERVVGLALSHPGGRATLAEVVSTSLSGAGAVDTVAALAQSLGCTVTRVADRPGLILSRLLLGYVNHAIGMVESGYATKEDVDAAMRFGCGYPVGPIAFADAVGLDVIAERLAALYEVTGERVHAPAPVLGQLVAAGRVGQRSGQGFYSYDAPGSSSVVASAQATGAAADSVRPVGSVGVIGSGTMATGIIEVLAKSGYDVTYLARSTEKVERVAGRLTKSLDKQVAKGRLEESARDEILSRTTGVTDIDRFGDVDLVVEAIVEDLDVKKDLFRRLDDICKPGAILATTTSSLPVIEMAAVTKRPADVVGLHFFNPAPIMKLVEIVTTVQTAPDVTATAREICARTKKVAVECGDRGGFIVNALLFPYLNDAVRLVDDHYATKEEVDAAVKVGAGFPMGPFALLDVVGNDVSLAIQEVLLDEFRDPNFMPAQSLRDVVAAGFVGRKSGRGFYDYS